MTSKALHRRTWWRATAFGALFCLVIGGSLGTAQAATPRTCLKWSAPPQHCQSAAELETAVESLLGREIFTSGPCERVVEVAIERQEPRGWSAEVKLRAGASVGTRRLKGSSNCSALRGPISLVLALLLETAETSVELSVPTESKEAKPHVTHPLRRRAPAHDLLLAGAFRTTSGLLPGIGMGLNAGAGLALWERRLSVQFAGTLWAPKSTRVSEPGGKFWGWHVGLDLCPRLFGAKQLRLALCLGAQLGAIHGSGLGLDYLATAQRPYAHAEAGLMMSIRVWSGLELTAQLAAMLPWLRSRFVYLDRNEAAIEIHRPGEFLPLAGLGLTWRSSATWRADSSVP